MSKYPTQKEQILDYMRNREWISPMDAIYHIGCTKLSTRIGELIRSGYQIEKQTVNYRNYQDQPRHYTKYRLVA